MPPTKSPGPADFNLKSLLGYDNHEFNSKKTRAPNWSMASRPKTSHDSLSPGPAAYRLENLTRNGKDCCKSASMFKRTNELKSDANPGPTQDAIDPYLYKGRAQPKYSMGKSAVDLRKDPNPGPNTEPTSLDIFKMRSPKFTMYGRIKEKNEDTGPAANKYDIHSSKAKVLRQNPAFTIYQRAKDPKADPNPGPSKYDLKSYNPFDQNPAYSLRRKHSEYSHVPVVPMDNC